MVAPKRVVLIVLDGFGERAESTANAIRQAHAPTLAGLRATHPTTTLGASGLDVGLPDGLMGNSEVGHLNLGAGRVVYQDIARIDKAIADGDFFTNPALVRAVESARESGGTLHLLGLTSPGGVHSSLEHAWALCELARRRGLTRVAWHAFLDGRDTPPTSAAGFLRQVDERLRQIGVGRVVTASGRFWGMDRDNRWDRVEVAWRMLTSGEGRVVPDLAAAVEAGYAAGETDEFVKPYLLAGDRGGADGGRPVGGASPSGGAVSDGPSSVTTVRDGDAIMFFNFRADRARELTRAFTAKEFPHFDRGARPALAAYVCMTRYDAQFDLPVAFPPQSFDHILAEVLAAHGVSQFRTAETEKYAHVTYFFNGGVETPFPGEDRRLVPSNRQVDTYDLVPAMSAVPVTDGVVGALGPGGPGFILVNFANPDMVGHTGKLGPAIAAVEAVDACLARILDAAAKVDATVLITADHGNCETMVDPQTGEPHTAHTTNRVPFIAVGPGVRGRALRSGGRLADVAPTVLEILGLPKPAEMSGQSLLASTP